MSTPVAIRDPHSGSSARVAVERGFNCFQFKAAVGSHVVDTVDADPSFADGARRPSGGGIPLLFPYPNRIRGGRYSWDGQEYELPAELVGHDPTGNAIHGFCLDRPWRIAAQGNTFVAGVFRLSEDAPDRRPLWPADFEIEVRYEVRNATLRCDVRIANPSDAPLPWGFGTHPYFKLPLSPESRADQCVVEAPITQQWVLTDCLPDGGRVPVSPDDDLSDGAYFGSFRFDDAFTGLRDAGGIVETAIYDEPAGLQLIQRFPAEFRELVIFTPSDRDAVCLEPYTCVTDAINLHKQGVDAGLRVLPPGEELRTWIEIEASPVLA